MKNKALFIYTHSSTFVRGDISILNKRFSLTEYKFKNNPKTQLPFSLIKLAFFLLFNINKFDLIYIWFADYHSFLPALLGKLFKKKVFIVIGGYDVCREKKYNYGSFSKPLRAYMTLHSIKWATCNLCVSKNIERTVKAIAPNAQTKLIYNGIQIPALQESFSPQLNNNSTQQLNKNTKQQLHSNNNSTQTTRENSSQKRVLCVALISTVQTFYIKGIDRYNKAASLLPNTQFILVGCNPAVFEWAGVKPSSNLKIVEAIPPEELVEYYRTSHVYCQFSRRESFSLSLAEAMSYRMIPVISTAGGMPEVTGGLGFSLYFYEPNPISTINNINPKLTNNSIKPNISASLNSNMEAAQYIRKALTLDKNNIFRERIIYNFTLEKREIALEMTLRN